LLGVDAGAGVLEELSEAFLAGVEDEADVFAPDSDRESVR